MKRAWKVAKMANLPGETRAVKVEKNEPFWEVVFETEDDRQFAAVLDADGKCVLWKRLQDTRGASRDV